MEGGKSAPIVRAPVFMRTQIILWDNVREPDGEACDIEIKLETTPTCFIFVYPAQTIYYNTGAGYISGFLVTSWIWIRIQEVFHNVDPCGSGSEILNKCILDPRF